jgi:hypothetical protein
MLLRKHDFIIELRGNNSIYLFQKEYILGIDSPLLKRNSIL